MQQEKKTKTGPAGKMAGWKWPGKEECLALLAEYDAQPSVIAHSKVVALAAKAIALELQKKGVEVDAQLVFASALLHDIAKLEKDGKGGWQPRHNHAQEGAKILLEEGMPEVARITERHVAEPGDAVPESWEELCVFYADKRVEWDKLVSLEERFAALARRYGHRPGAIERLEAVLPFVKKVEKKLFDKLQKKPEELFEMAYGK